MWGETEGKSNIMGRMGARQEYAAGAGLGPVLARSERVSLPGTRAERKKKNRQPARGLPEHGPLDSNYHSERNMGVGVGWQPACGSVESVGPRPRLCRASHTPV